MFDGAELSLSGSESNCAIAPILMQESAFRLCERPRCESGSAFLEEGRRDGTRACRYRRL